MIEFELTQEDWDVGTPCNGASCAISIAIQRKYGLTTEVRSEVTVVDGCYYKNTPELNNYVDAFDMGDEVELPKTFILHYYTGVL